MSAPKSSHYIPTLDGWRAVAILMVMVFHFFQHLSSVPSSVLTITNEGGYGVDIFFALSGFLICTRILIGMEKYGKLDLTIFYIRRTFRILPPAYFYLLVLAILTFVNVIYVDKYEIISSLSFWRNYLPITMSAAKSFTNHFWSLAIEEHFYLIFPFIMAFMKGKKRLWSLIFFAVAIAVWRAIDSRYHVFTFLSPHLEYNYQFTFARLDSLLWGAILGILYFEKSTRKKIEKILSPITCYLSIGLILILVFTAFPAKRVFLSLIFPVMVLSTVINTNTWWSRFLETSTLRWIGGLSYSLYLWQHLFLNGSQEMSPSWFQFLQSPYIGWFATFAMAIFSYHIVEQPLIRYGRNVAKKYS